MNIKQVMRTVAVIWHLTSVARTNDQVDEHLHRAAETHEEQVSVMALTKHQLFHIHLETAEVNESFVPIPVTLSGKVALNERECAAITARLAGCAEKLSALAGDRVSAKPALAQICSQEFLTMQME